MNELKIGDVTVTRIEEMHGPIMPRTSSSRRCPKRAAATALTPSISVRQLRRGEEHLHVRLRPVYQA